MPRSETRPFSLEEGKARFEAWMQNRKGEAVIPSRIHCVAFVSLTAVPDLMTLAGRAMADLRQSLHRKNAECDDAKARDLPTGSVIQDSLTLLSQ